jgi:peptide/nickel transport system permease protein
LIYLSQRLLGMLLVVWLSATLSFFALRILPGDAIQSQLVDAGADKEIIALRRAQQGLDRPLIQQYLFFLSGLVRGNLGYSLVDHRPVAEAILQQLQPTFTLALTSIAFAVILGLTLGIWGTFNHITSMTAQAFTALALSVPIYWTGTLAIYLFTVQMRISLSDDTTRTLLPAFVLGFHTAGTIARVIQTNIQQTRQQDFIQTAKAKGLTTFTVFQRHILRPALPPIITIITLQMGFLLSGAVIVESLFVRPGVGTLLLNAVRAQDYPLVQGIIILSAIVYILLNSFADVAAAATDPRIRF